MLDRRISLSAVLFIAIASAAGIASAKPPPPAPVPAMAGDYDGVHRDWRDSVHLNPDGTYARGNGDPGHWTFDGHTLVLNWKNWGPEPVEFHGPGQFEAGDHHFKLTKRDQPDYSQIPGQYEGKHRDWKDVVNINADGTYARGNGDPGVWIYDGHTLVLYWKNWGPETLDMREPGHYSANGYEFHIHKRGMGAPPPQVAYAPPPQPMYAPPQPFAQPVYAPPQPIAPVGNSSRLISTNKQQYRRGEPVVVSYFGMAGNSTDWTTIAKAEEPPDSWGNWEYTNGTPNGTRNVSGLAPGSYEARAYFSNGTDLQDRVAFTVTP